jgi:hypothetical protein
LTGLAREQELKAQMGARVRRVNSPKRSQIPPPRTAEMEGKSHRDSLRDDRAADQELTQRDDTQPRISNNPKNQEREPPLSRFRLLFLGPTSLKKPKTGKHLTLQTISWFAEPIPAR